MFYLAQVDIYLVSLFLSGVSVKSPASDQITIKGNLEPHRLNWRRRVPTKVGSLEAIPRLSRDLQPHVPEPVTRRALTPSFVRCGLSFFCYFLWQPRGGGDHWLGMHVRICCRASGVGGVEHTEQFTVCDVTRVCSAFNVKGNGGDEEEKL